jgi:WhiB family redox-sensing transcriptional regulator
MARITWHVWLAAVAQKLLKHGWSGYKRGCRCDECRYVKRTAPSNVNRRKEVTVEVEDRIGTAWKAQAACHGQPIEWWFEGKPTDRTYRQALAICAECPVRTQCLQWALQWPVHDLHGIWGGTSQRERVRLTDQRKAPTCPEPITLRTTGRLSGITYKKP